MDLTIESPGHFYVGYRAFGSVGKPSEYDNSAQYEEARLAAARLERINEHEDKHMTLMYIGESKAEFGNDLFYILDRLTLPAEITVPVLGQRRFGSQLALALDKQPLIESRVSVEYLLGFRQLGFRKDFSPHVSLGPHADPRVQAEAVDLLGMPGVTLRLPYIKFRDQRYRVKKAQS